MTTTRYFLGSDRENHQLYSRRSFTDPWTLAGNQGGYQILGVTSVNGTIWAVNKETYKLLSRNDVDAPWTEHVDPIQFQDVAAMKSGELLAVVQPGGDLKKGSPSTQLWSAIGGGPMTSACQMFSGTLLAVKPDKKLYQQSGTAWNPVAVAEGTSWISVAADPSGEGPIGLIDTQGNLWKMASLTATPQQSTANTPPVIALGIGQVNTNPSL